MIGEIFIVSPQLQPYTTTSIERMTALVDGVEYIVRNGVAGDIGECGTWRGRRHDGRCKDLDALRRHDSATAFFVSSRK
jgi:Macrocin-O-methyltransferase (TylF)